MAAKNPDLVALPDKFKDALRLLNNAFQLDWDTVIVTKGVDAVKARMQELKDKEIEYYKQNNAKPVITVSDRQEADRLLHKETKERLARLKEESRILSIDRVNEAKASQAALF